MILAGGGVVVGAPSIDDIEDMVRGDLDAVSAMVVRRLAEPEEHDDEHVRQRLLLVRADVEGRRGDPVTNARLVREGQSWATEHGDSLVLARCSRLLAWSFLRVGDTALALEHAISAVELLEWHQRPSVRADALLFLGTCLGACGSFEEARRRYDEASRLAEAAGNLELRLTILNNLAYTECLAGRSEEAVAAAELLRLVASPHRVLCHQELDTLASAYVSAGRFKEAEQVLLPVSDAEIDAEAADFDALVVCLLTLAGVQRRLGATAAAQVSLDRCRALCEKWELRGLAVQAQGEQAELHAAEGNYELAYRVFREFHETAAELDSVDRAARARTLQAIFETQEARRDSALFRELAEVDPLTGLRNRRFVDASLDALLVQVVDLGAPLTVALLDLDHFKAVNDTWSHEVGDTVLCRVARLLERSLSGVPGGVVARMGGEEFLLVLPGLAGADALLEEVRQSVADAGWCDLVGDLAVTISIGAATAPQDAIGRSDLLRHADRNLYAAKRSGRDRVVATERDEVSAEALPLAI